jgi:hypothetical protein
MQYCHAEPRIATTISGAARSTEVEANVRALAAPIDHELLRHVQAALVPVKDVTWASGNWKR